MSRLMDLDVLNLYSDRVGYRAYHRRQRLYRISAELVLPKLATAIGSMGIIEQRQASRWGVANQWQVFTLSVMGSLGDCKSLC